MKNLYVIAGGSDGYVDFTYTFDEEVANGYLRDNEYYDCESYHNVSVLIVPDDFVINENNNWGDN